MSAEHRSPAHAGATNRAGWKHASLALALVALWLSASWWLQPDPRGFGTHEQLGMPPCHLRTSWGFDCPSCGVTTSLVWLGRGNVVRSLGTQPLGFLLVTAFALWWLRGWWLLRRGRRGPDPWLADPRWLFWGGSVVLACWALRVGVLSP